MTAWPRWEVFVRARRGLAHQHAGTVHAADGEAALRAWHKATPEAEDLPLIVSLPEETKRELKALGYAD